MQVKFKQRTPDGMLRQPVFLRLRDDKKAGRVRLADGGDGDAAADGRAAEPRRRADEPPERPTVAFTNLDKVFWPADGYTKGDLIAYYEGIAEWLLPYLKDRPVVLTRYPDGIDGKSFFQKDAPVYAPSWLRLETMWSEHAEREIRYFVLDDVESLLYVANMGTIPLHVWSSRVAALERPDWCILDLDPKGAPLKHVVAIARHMHELCEDVGLPNFVKTSGSTGLHVLIPLGARYTYEQSRTLAELLARFTAKSLPDDRDDRALGLGPRRQGLPRLPAERPRAAARVAVLRAAAAGRAGLDADRVVRGQRPLEARALQHPLGAQVAAEARRPAGRRAHGVVRHAGRARVVDAPARRLARQFVTSCRRLLESQPKRRSSFAKTRHVDRRPIRQPRISARVPISKTPLRSTRKEAPTALYIGAANGDDALVRHRRCAR